MRMMANVNVNLSGIFALLWIINSQLNATQRQCILQCSLYMKQICFLALENMKFD